MKVYRGIALLAGVISLTTITATGGAAELVCSAKSGAWSDASTWAGGHVPRAGDQVQIREGHAVTYDVNSDAAVRSIHIAGTLSFAADKTTRLNVGLIKIQRGDNASADGFNCDTHLPAPEPGRPRPALEVGTLERPIAADVTATIRLVALDGMDPETCPAIVCCGGRMDFHGAPLSRTWVKLGATAKAGATAIRLSEPVTGWRVGDKIIITATRRDVTQEEGSYRPGARTIEPLTEERTLRAFDGQTLTLDQPLAHDHLGAGDYRGEVANLSRNVIVESADPAKARGHTMYHRGSAGSIRYAEFRHLGKAGVLGKYSLHFHLVGDSMRGSSVLGASIWDSGNRWITIHGTNYLVVRDCVGYQSVGHGFFLEDGTETHNVLDRNLAVQAFAGQPLPNQVFAFDSNSGAGFWWANSLNSFTRNVAVECDRYGFRFEATPGPNVDLRKRVFRSLAERETVDIRTLPFIRFEANEAHALAYGLNLGEGVADIGPDRKHPFVIRDLKVWEAVWGLRPETPSVVLDGLMLFSTKYGIFRTVTTDWAYRRLKIKHTFLAGPVPTGYVEERSDFPAPLAPVDDLAPATVITEIHKLANGSLVVRGTATDDGPIARVVVNGREAQPLSPNFAEWEVTLAGPPSGVRDIVAHAEDAAGNIETRPHRIAGQ
jgi:hypothetical protein